MLAADGETSMTARRKKRPPIGAAAVITETPAAREKLAPIIERPDGYYWVAPDGRQEFGPFDSVDAARADRDRDDEEVPAPGETLQEAEFEIGIADWIDPETGEPAEGQSPPHLEND
jgi:hypothetical protein